VEAYAKLGSACVVKSLTSQDIVVDLDRAGLLHKPLGTPEPILHMWDTVKTALKANKNPTPHQIELLSVELLALLTSMWIRWRVVWAG
jgi:hypothetical protein